MPIYPSIQNMSSFFINNMPSLSIYIKYAYLSKKYCLSIYLSMHMLAYSIVSCMYIKPKCTQRNNKTARRHNNNILISSEATLSL